jgi:hypothetical protein
MATPLNEYRAGLADQIWIKLVESPLAAYNVLAIETKKRPKILT